MNNREYAPTTCDNRVAFGSPHRVNNSFKGNGTVIGESATAIHDDGQGTRKAMPATGGTRLAPQPN